MSITREQVADLRPGDVVRVTLHASPDVHTEGPTTEEGGLLRCGPVFLRYSGGGPAGGIATLTVVSRASRPFYDNHPRTEPVDGDIVRDRDGDAWSRIRDEWWISSPDELPNDHPDGSPITEFRPLTLLWDGETDQPVTS